MRGVAATPARAEYTNLDVELGIITGHHDVMDVLTGALAEVMTAIGQCAADAVARLGITLPAVPDRIRESTSVRHRN